ncbi:SurA N-terminal domain-containing protein [Nocardioides marmorisolisilvae]|uniref:Uncharacterized protein n=1 Tax=Nocardioides marmorisolisilvae TaxID=1542737 RepID=A0A3N0DZ98_9ACTN|nr:SurA N-terminal domain-containing protein [Nocardioides marmorisolisilvae]RNL80938.1 hypothetical protein EFL95_00695 [Nocardioides marmorisolisilvae]
MKAHRLVVLAAAGVSALVLSGCSQSLGGDVAATVDGRTISNADVKFLARLQCDAIDNAGKDPAQSGSVQTVSRRQVRADMVNALVQSRLNAELGKEQGVTYDRATYRQAMDQFEPTVQAVAAKDRAKFRTMIGKLYQSQLEVYAIAARELGAQGVDKPTQQQVEALVTKIQGDYRKQADIEIDPIYGAGKSGIAGSDDTSISEPVSSFAKASVASPEDAGWAGSLPANQKCG